MCISDWTNGCELKLVMNCVLEQEKLKVRPLFCKAIGHVNLILGSVWINYLWLIDQSSAIPGHDSFVRC